MWTWIIGIIVFGALATVILGMVRSKRRGKSTCAYGCSACAMSQACHQDVPDAQRNPEDSPQAG